jgi:glycosyltransferase involved in cell wall biosynthesis
MYALTIGVPFRRKTDIQCEVAADWAKSLILLRDALAGRFGEIVVAAPELPPGEGMIVQQTPHILDAHNDGIRFESLGQKNWRARQFWRMFPRLRATCNRLAAQAQVVHCGINDLWQPYSLAGFYAARRRGTTTVFVLDGDAIKRLQDLATGQGVLHRCRTNAYCALYYRIARRAVASADLALLKGRALHERYGRFARNAKDFFDTSYSLTDIVAAETVDCKCRELLAGGSIRCLYLGRLVDYKGIDYAIKAVAAAAGQGAPITFDIIGDGPAEKKLRQVALDAGAGQTVRFLGPRAYGPELLREIRAYHVMLFTSLAEETPRALFDGMAGGCALVAFAIPFVRQVLEQCRHGAAVPIGDIAALSEALLGAHRDRNTLAQWVRAAVDAAHGNTADVWYRRRAQWTLEAYERHCAASRVSVGRDGKPDGIKPRGDVT